MGYAGMEAEDVALAEVDGFVVDDMVDFAFRDNDDFRKFMGVEESVSA